MVFCHSWHHKANMIILKALLNTVKVQIRFLFQKLMRNCTDELHKYIQEKTNQFNGLGGCWV